jgi:hypothetical protein
MDNKKRNFILSQSNNTQSEVVDKPKYKDLIKQPLLVKITASLETNDHDNFCSDEECEYERCIVKTKTIIPEQYKQHPLGKIANTSEYKWTKHLCVPDLNVYGSGVCECDYNESHGLDRHHYRYTIEKVEIVKNPQYKTNGFGFVILAGYDYESEGGKDTYGFCKTIEEATLIATEAVKTGKKNKYKRNSPLDWTHVVNLDTLKVVYKARFTRSI